MDEKDIITVLIGGLVSILVAAAPSIISLLPGWLQNQNKVTRKEEMVDFAKRRVDFLSAWFQACKQSDTGSKLAGIRRKVAEELDEIKAQVDESLYVGTGDTPEGSRVLGSLLPLLTLMRILGFSSLAFPFILLLGGLFFGLGLQSSMGMYYYTPVQALLVGFLVEIGICLFLYKGYRRIDRILGDLGCVFAMGTALFPAAAQMTGGPLGYIFGILHNEFFFFFFLTLAFFSGFLFTKTDPAGKPTHQKLQRNRVYQTCGYLIFICVPLIAICLHAPAGIVAITNELHLIYWLESIAFVAAGISWLTKAEAIVSLNDEVIPLKKLYPKKAQTV